MILYPHWNRRIGVYHRAKKKGYEVVGIDRETLTHQKLGFAGEQTMAKKIKQESNGQWKQRAESVARELKVSRKGFIKAVEEEMIRQAAARIAQERLDLSWGEMGGNQEAAEAVSSKRRK
jgi:hypothetical protein